MKKRKAFGKLITLLNKLGVTRLVHMPVVSNAYNLESIDSLLKDFEKRSAAYKGKGWI